MKWINHTIVAGSLTAMINPLAVPAAIVGGIAPDILEKIFSVRHHRKETHYLIVWIAATLFPIFVWDFHGILFGLAFGGLTHILADSLNPSGVPFALGCKALFICSAAKFLLAHQWNISSAFQF